MLDRRRLTAVCLTIPLLGLAAIVAPSSVGAVPLCEVPDPPPICNPQDTDPPDDTAFSGGPTGVTKATSATFTNFRAPSEPNAFFECRLDTPGATGRYVACGSVDSGDLEEQYTGLTINGDYTFRLRALDPNDNADPTPPSRTWTVDTVAPVPSLTGGPAQGSTVASKTATFTIATNGGTLACKLNTVDTHCGGTYSALAEGPQTLLVTATDAAGNSAGVSRSWTVDTVAPVPTLTGGPAQGSTVASKTATFTIATDNGTLACKLNTVDTHCGGTYGALAEGEQTLLVTATDAAGNRASVSRTWTVDTVAPVVTITGGPASGAASNEPSPAFDFAADEPAGFECSLDGAAFSPCTAPKGYAGLADGPHVFVVRAADLVANTSGGQVVTWAIDTVAPDTLLVGGPPPDSTSPVGSATFAFSSPDPAASFQCRLDGEPFAACASPFTRAGIVTGDHAFEVRAVDAAGNADTIPARRTWRVNILDADADGYNRPQDCNDANPAIHPGATDAPRNGIDEDCSGTDADHPRLDSAILYQYRSVGSATRFTSLSVQPVRAGSSIRVSCSGRGCPFKVSTRKVARDARRLSLSAGVRRARLRPGARLEVRVTKPGMIGVVRRLTMRSGKRAPRRVDLCLPPGAKAPGACPL